MKFLLPLVILLASTFAFAQDATVISQAANLRGLPTLKGLKITTLPKDTKMRVIGSDGTWYLVQTPEYMGWMYYKLIKVNDAKKPRKITLFERAKVVGGSASLRGTASEDGMQTDVLKLNTALDVYGKTGGWYLVQTAKYVGWLRSESVKEVRPIATSLAASPANGTIFSVENTDARRNPRVNIRNNANRTLQLTFGGIKYIIKPKRGRILNLAPGKYKYTAAGGGATPYTRVENFRKGKVYKVNFLIRKRPRKRRR